MKLIFDRDVQPLKFEERHAVPWFGKEGMVLQYETKQLAGMEINDLAEEYLSRKLI